MCGRMAAALIVRAPAALISGRPLRASMRPVGSARAPRGGRLLRTNPIRDPDASGCVCGCGTLRSYRCRRRPSRDDRLLVSQFPWRPSYSSPPSFVSRYLQISNLTATAITRSAMVDSSTTAVADEAKQSTSTSAAHEPKRSADAQDPPAKRAKTGVNKENASVAAADDATNDDVAPITAAPVTNTKMPEHLTFAKTPGGAIKLMTWNVASLKASLAKGALRYIEAEDADIFCLQETKANTTPSPSPFSRKQYPHQYWSHCTARKGYSGTAVFSKIKPISCKYTIGDKDLDNEGRFVILEFEHWFFVGCYIVNAGSNLERLALKQKHYVKLQAFLKSLQDQKPVIWSGDLNVAHHPIDLARPDSNSKSAGFTPEERADFSRVLKELDMVDTFRHKHPNKTGMYTYFSYRFGCRSKNIGWRLDYFVISRTLMDRVVSVDIRSEVYGASDHVPLVLTLTK